MALFCFGGLKKTGLITLMLDPFTQFPCLRPSNTVSYLPFPPLSPLSLPLFLLFFSLLSSSPSPPASLRFLFWHHDLLPPFPKPLSSSFLNLPHLHLLHLHVPQLCPPCAQSPNILVIESNGCFVQSPSWLECFAFCCEVENIIQIWMFDRQLGARQPAVLSSWDSENPLSDTEYKAEAHYAEFAYLK